MKDGFETITLQGSASGEVPVPVIGLNGDWYVGNKDTGVEARGPQGLQGLPGPAGETGPQGPRGETGPMPELAENLTETVPGKALDAVEGKVLDDKISALSLAIDNYQTTAVIKLNGSADVAANGFTDVEIPFVKPEGFPRFLSVVPSYNSAADIFVVVKAIFTSSIAFKVINMSAIARTVNFNAVTAFGK